VVRGAFIGIIAVLLATTPKKAPPMKICWLGRFIIIRAIYKLAKESLLSQGKRRESKKYIIAST